MHFCDPWVVDLQDEARVDDRLVLNPQRVADRLQILFVAPVILVCSDSARRNSRHEGVLSL
jgi:hypothetical protein